MMNELIVGGLDGGGTSTRAVIAARDGTILGTGRSGPSNYGDVGVATTRENIQRAFCAAWEQAGMTPRPLDAAYLGLANVTSSQDRETIQEIAHELELADPLHLTVHHDIRIAHAGGLAGKNGIVLIVGTGSSCYGRTADGHECRVGGWSYLVDDMGAGYWLGQQAMVAAVQAEDGRLPETRLREGVMAALGIAEMEDFLRRVYHTGLERREIAALAPLVLENASEDKVAGEIVRQGAAHLASMVVTAARRLALSGDDLNVTAVGGVVQGARHYAQAIHTAILERLPAAHLHAPALTPVGGAVLLALESIGQPSTDLVVENLSHL